MKTLLFLFLLFFPFLLSAEEPISRHLIGLWDSQVDGEIEKSLVHRNLEMPLNYLGFDILYYDVHDVLPELAGRKDVAGILICFQDATAIKDPEGFIEWAVHASENGKKIVIMGNPGFIRDENGVPTSASAVNRLYDKIGFKTAGNEIQYPFDYSIVSGSNDLLPYEQNFSTILPPFYVNKVNDAIAKSYLRVMIKDNPATSSDLVIVSTRGGYAAQDYAFRASEKLSEKNPRAIGWHLNPFRFFELVFNTDSRLIPDTTTLAGRRIFYSFCEGDAFTRKTKVNGYKKEMCGSVILDRIVKANPDVPVSIALTAAELDPSWSGSKKTQRAARALFALPQVEPASYTYSSPYVWDFFKEDQGENEEFSNSYCSRKAHPVLPRAYAKERFELEREIGGSVAYLSQLSPMDKPVKLICWPGDAKPWDAPLALCESAGIKNIGGGEAPLDSDHASLLFLHPLGKKVGKWTQIYSSSSSDLADEVALPHLQILPSALRRTDIPQRVKPIALHYHMYSGLLDESLESLSGNLEYIRTLEPIFMRTSRYCEIAEGFYSVDLIPLGHGKWKVLNRKGLQTLRIDNAGTLKPDLVKSSGVIGYNKHQGSLYLYLDADVESPIVHIHSSSLKPFPFLKESNWEAWKLSRSEKEFHFLAKGWGPLKMLWKVPYAGEYRITATPEEGEPRSTAIMSEGDDLFVELDLSYDMLYSIDCKKVRG